MRCSACGTENEAGRKFCLECGAPLAVLCSACGSPNNPKAKFCGECGTSLPEAGLPAAVQGHDAAPQAERRLVSVLFADLVGFTTLSESRDAEEVRELLSRYFDTCRRLISLYGGTVEKFIGDAVMAVWGTPVATEDDAERAVRAALDLTRAVEDLGAEVGAPDLQARAGVLTGEAAVNLAAQGEGMVAGDLVNTASRIQAAAGPGQVFVGESTRRTTEAAIVYEDAEVHELKGKAEPVQLWRALRVVAGRLGSARSVGLEPPFVGRDRDLRLVKELFHGSADERKAHLVSVVGIAGIGKSRLTWEFFKYIDGLVDLILWHRGRSLAYGEGVAYWALAEMVRGRAGILEGEGADSAWEKLRATLEQYVADPEERKWIEPPLAHLIGLEERSADRDALFAAWRLFFERLAEANPVAMVFEDMQWADAGLLDFIEYLLDWSRSYPLFVMTLARPELTTKHPSWGAGKRNFTSLYLEPLSEDAMDRLLSGLVPGLPPELRARILGRAEGIPLYAVETVRMLLDRGLLARVGNEYRPAGPIDALEVPETLHALIAARLDGLTVQERRLVQDASVLGKTAMKPALAAVSGFSGEELDGLLDSLVRKEILSIQADPRSPERGQYGFLQDLVKTVAHETLSRKDRKALHLAAAGYLEGSWGTEEEEIAEVVASHYLEAFRAEPEDREVKAKAAEMLLRAAQRAASLGANAEAQRHFEQAAELADQGLVRAELLERAAGMAWMGARAEQASSHLEQAAREFEAAGQMHAAARVQSRLADVDFVGGRLDQALERMESAYAVLSEEEPDEDLATLTAQLGRLHRFRGDAGRALEFVEKALGVAEGLQLRAVFCDALITKAALLHAQERPEEGRVLLEHALKAALEHDLFLPALRAYNNLGFLLETQDRLQEEQELGREAIELARRFGSRFWELGYLAGDISVLMALGRWDEALARAEEVRRSDEEIVHSAQMLHNLTPILVIHALRGDREAVEREMELLTPLEGNEDVQLRAGAASVRSTVENAGGRHAEALEWAMRALAERPDLGIAHQAVRDGLVQAFEAAMALGDVEKAEEMLGVVERLKPGELTPFLRGQGARFAARVGAVRGEPDGVEPGFLAAAAAFREAGLRFWLGVTLLEHGEWLLAQGRAADAAPLMSEAEEIFDALRAAPFLERVRHAVETAPASPVQVG